MSVNLLRITLVLMTSVAVVSCATRIPFALEQSNAPIERIIYVDAAKAGADIFAILPGESLVLIKVGRAGSMSRLGHDHAVASNDLEGLVAIHEGPTVSFADIAMPLKNLVVDNLAHRQKLDLISEPTAKDIAGTYSNMQRMLDADTWPWVTAKIKLTETEETNPLANVVISLHGVTRDFMVPLQLSVDTDRMSVEGHLVINQSDFGITPFSALGGLLRVTNELEIHFDLTAERRDL